MSKTIPNYKKIAFILGTLSMSIVVGYLAFAWTEPSVSPPGGNVDAPLNVGPTTQTKIGGIIIGTVENMGWLSVYGDINTLRIVDANYSEYYIALTAAGGISATLAGKVGIGTTTPKTMLDVVGAIKVGTQDTCDANTAGAIRYVAATKSFEGCNGARWNRISEITGLPCEQSVTFSYRGSNVTYDVVESNGRCWLDRNLGATKVAIYPFDPDGYSYGDLFQWGREGDGHQSRSSSTTTTISTISSPGHSNFILSTSHPYGAGDWYFLSSNNLWQGVSGINNPCPAGWRIPTAEEWEAELATWATKDPDGAIASPLKLPLAGRRDRDNGNFWDSGQVGFYWSSTPYNGLAMYLQLGVPPKTQMNSFYRAEGCSVRCIKEL